MLSTVGSLGLSGWKKVLCRYRHSLIGIISFVLAIGLSLIPTAQAQGGYPPFLDPHVNDYAKILTPEDATSLRSQLKTFQASSGKQVVVLTIQSIQNYNTGDQTIESFATNLFNTWGIGDSTRNEGVLVLVAPGDRKVRIELGSGYAPAWNDEMQVIIQEYMLPNFKQGQFSQGTVKGTEALMKRLTREPPGVNPPVSRDSEPIPDSSTGNGLNPVTTGGAVGGSLATVGGMAWLQHKRRYGKRSCPKCQAQMVRLDEKADDQYLKNAQKLEEELKSVDYDVWLCPSCQYHQVNKYGSWTSSYSECPKCNNRTLATTTRTLSRATTTSEGREEVTKDCKYCPYHDVDYRSIPRVTESSSSSSSSWSSSSWSSSSDSSSSSWSSSDDGGSSSGGGSSGDW